MPDVFRTMIITAADAPLIRDIADMFAGSPQHMWQTGLSATGKAPAAHYISTGYVPEGYQVLTPCQWWEWQQPDPEQPGQWVMVDSYPGRPDFVYEACRQAEVPVPCTLEEVEMLFARSDITPQDPWVALGRLGLQIVQPDEPVATSEPLL